ncbi:MAG: response regulator transcription factor [Pseudomonadota bacterium]
MRILIIEDNSDIVANLYGFLEPKGHQLDCALNGYAGLALARENSYDVIILDIMMPGMTGIEMCRKLRDELQDSTPVLMLTARDTLEDKVSGFANGADDYLVKPFSLVELEVRLQALVRRSGRNVTSPRLLTVGELTFDPAAYRALRGPRVLTLTKTGYVILKCLMLAAPSVVSRATLESEVWGENRPDSDALRTHIHALRQTLDKPEPFPMLRTVPGIGFQLVTPDDPV